MKQSELIKTVSKTLKDYTGINAALLYGSFARKQFTSNSDIDLAVLINEKYNAENLEMFLRYALKEYESTEILNVSLRNKIAVFIDDIPRIEIAVLQNIEEIKRNYLGSKIPKHLINASILFDKTGQVFPILQNWTSDKAKISKEILVNDLISKFIYEFESCSMMHSRSDGYQFYYFYNIALHVATQLKYISEGNIDFYFLPKKLTTHTIKDKENQQKFYDTAGTLYLRDANKKKRLLLDFFYSSLEKLKSKRLKKAKAFLEKIYWRDYIWNFRDIAKFNKNIMPGKIYRTSTLTAFQNNKFLLSFLKEKNITTIIDLRAKREIEESHYNLSFINNFRYVKASFDPWNQPEWFKKTEHYGTNTEIAYRFFVKACKKQLKTVFETINNSKGAVAIHCLAGKDRTGLVIMLINMLMEVPYETMLNDYLASEMDSEEKKFKIYYNNIIKEGGIWKYLKSCGLTDDVLNQFKNNLQYESN